MLSRHKKEIGGIRVFLNIIKYFILIYLLGLILYRVLYYSINEKTAHNLVLEYKLMVCDKKPRSAFNNH